MIKTGLQTLLGVGLLFAGGQQASALEAADGRRTSPHEPNTCLTIHGPALIASNDVAKTSAMPSLVVETESKADCMDTGAKTAHRMVHESRLSGLGHRNNEIAQSKNGISQSVIEPDQRDIDGFDESKTDTKNSNKEPGHSGKGSSKSGTSQATNAIVHRDDGNAIDPGASPILRTVLAPVPAGAGSAFRIPAWLTLTRPTKQNATNTFDSASRVSGDAQTTGSYADNVGKPVVGYSPDSANGNPQASNSLASNSNSLPGDSTAGNQPTDNISAANPLIAPVAVAMNPQQAVLQDPDAFGKPKIAQNDPSAGSTAVKSRSYPPPLDPVFPSTEYIGIAGTMPIGVPDTDPEYPLEKSIYKVLPELRKHRIKIYGWINPGGGYSSSRNSNIPQSYSVVPRRLELDQAIFRVERTPDTVQQEHSDWGFRATMLYGIDYRWTTAEGWYPATKELLQHNYEYGLDPVELYGMFYIPKIAGHKFFQGMVMKYGRFISPPDIEAQLAPDNFLWTHSLMFTVDCYTQTGLLNTIKLNDNWSVQAGISAGADIAPWDKAAIPTGLFLARWVSKNNNDSIYGGMNSVNNGRFRGARAVLGQQQMIQAINTQIQQGVAKGATGYTNFDGSTYQFANLQPPAHDNLQQMNLTWSHRFNKKGTIVTMTEAYFLYQYNALVGGTVNNGPPHTYAGLTGPGAYINGIAPAMGVVNYLAFKLTDKDYMTIRPVDYLMDYKGERTGFPTTYASWTVGWAHRFNSLMMIRPEIRYERALNYHEGDIVKPYDNGNRRYQFTFGVDLIARY